MPVLIGYSTAHYYMEPASSNVGAKDTLLLYMVVAFFTSTTVLYIRKKKWSLAHSFQIDCRISVDVRYIASALEPYQRRVITSRNPILSMLYTISSLRLIFPSIKNYSFIKPNGIVSVMTNSQTDILIYHNRTYVSMGAASVSHVHRSMMLIILSYIFYYAIESCTLNMQGISPHCWSLLYNISSNRQWAMNILPISQYWASLTALINPARRKSTYNNEWLQGIKYQLRAI